MGRQDHWSESMNLKIDPNDRLGHLLTKEFTNRTEAQNLNAVCQYLSAQGYFFWRQNNTGVKRVQNGKHFWTFSKWSRPGVPDVFLFHKGIFYAIEVKSTLKYQNQDQKRFQQEFEANGGVYILARSIEALLKAGI